MNERVAEAAFEGEIEIVRGTLSGERADAVAGFLAEHAGVEEAAARRDLDRVVCVALAPDGVLCGVSSVVSAVVPLVGGVRLWLHGGVTSHGADAAEDELIAAGFAALEDEFEPEGRGPIGLCQVISDRDRLGGEAVCPRTGLIHAGFLEDGSQVRIRFFAEASIGPRQTPLAPAAERARPPELDGRYRIEPLAESSVSADDVLALWARERALPPSQAARRVHEVELVAVDERDGVVGVSSSYLQRNPRLRMDMRHFRAFVAREHRSSSIASLLTLRGCERLERAYVTGEDTRAAGVLSEVENDLLKRFRNEARWAATGLTYLGENERGDHIRVRYFPGARVPPPD